MQNLTKADQELKQYEECLEYSEQVSEGLKKGAEYVGRGMVKGAIKSSEWMYLGRYFFRIYRSVYILSNQIFWYVITLSTFFVL